MPVLVLIAMVFRQAKILTCIVSSMLKIHPETLYPNPDRVV